MIPRNLFVWLPIVALAATGCDSLVSGECEPGMTMIAGTCRLAGGPDAGDDDVPDGPVADADGSTVDGHTVDGPGEGSDAGTPDGGTTPDAAITPDADTTPDADVVVADADPADAAVCTADTTSDPMNCGWCGHVCPTGLCADSVCVGDIHGHVVVIGHDFRAHNVAMARVIANAAALSLRDPLRVARWHGTAATPSIDGTDQALASGMAAIGRAWTPVTATSLTDATTVADVIIVFAQRGPAGDMADEGAAAGPALTQFVTDGGVVVVLEGNAGTSHDLITATGLVTVSDIAPDPGAVISPAIPTDGVVTGVPVPYAGANTTVSLTTPVLGVLVDGIGQAVVVHVSP